MSKNNQSLSHTTRKCKYHIVFTPKYKRRIIYGKYKQSIGEILSLLCERKGVEIIEANASKDHVYILESILPKLSVSGFIVYLKGKSSLMIFDRFVNLKYRFVNLKYRYGNMKF